ncbi:hypothetical protein K8W59_18020 [Nocardioides rotundus]|uniref:hypothetical protein n=1 Tax=Nocardioides rotundus TaxID=1774216 RepID=UPI001CC13E53|nr:hypothetical protein [Nocardioides rotundus]UAL29613.1 hypothetical protein K8W59_18020 [Nocardioides rotundus]
MPSPRVRRTPFAVAAAALVGGGVLAVVPLAAPAGAVDATTCERESVAASARSVDVVFSGTVGSSEAVRRAGERLRQVRVEVDRIYQGSVDRDTTVVTMPQADRPVAGEEWYFFADGSGGRYTAAPCSGSRVSTPETTRRVEAALGAGEVYVEPEPPREPLAYEQQDVADQPPLSRMLAPGAGLSLLALLGLLVTRRRHP